MALIVMTNGLWVFGVAISIFLLFHVCAIRRLEQVEEFTRNIDLTDVEKLPPLAYSVDDRARDEVDMLAVAVIDLTDRIKEEFARRRQLEQQLNQTQKMEALGTWREELLTISIIFLLRFSATRNSVSIRPKRVRRCTIAWNRSLPRASELNP